MPISLPQIDSGTFVSTDPGGVGTVAVVQSDGTVAGLHGWNPTTGDVSYTAPAGSAVGGGTRRHLFDRAVEMAGTLAVAQSATVAGGLAVSGNAALAGPVSVGATLNVLDQIAIGTGAAPVPWLVIDMQSTISAASGNGGAVFIRPTITATGNADNIFGLDLGVTVAKGGRTGLTTYGIYTNTTTAGSGSLANAYGVYVAALPAATNQWAFYAVTNQSYFGGGLTSGGQIFANSGLWVVSGNTLVQTLTATVNAATTAFYRPHSAYGSTGSPAQEQGYTYRLNTQPLGTFQTGINFVNAFSDSGRAWMVFIVSDAAGVSHVAGTVDSNNNWSLVGGFGCNGAAAQGRQVSGGTLSGVIAALVANGTLSS